jgi:hypothetical protein
MSGHRIAVVTPYHREPIALLEQGHRSVLRQDVAADHILVADGHAVDAIDGWTASHVRLPREHGDNGNTPRGLGSLLAEREGYDFVAYLDADNWFHDGHLRALLDLWEQRRVPVCASLRTFHHFDGTPLAIREPEEEQLRHIDTSCLLIHRSGFRALPAWLDMPGALSPICDRVFFAALRHHRLGIALSGQRTVAFRSRYRAHYEAVGAAVPPDAKGPEEVAQSFAWLATGAGVSECVARLGFWPSTYL